VKTSTVTISAPDASEHTVSTGVVAVQCMPHHVCVWLESMPFPNSIGWLQPATTYKTRPAITHHGKDLNLSQLCLVAHLIRGSATECAGRLLSRV
jgi:hypothetical protein